MWQALSVTTTAAYNHENDLQDLNVLGSFCLPFETNRFRSYQKL